jgi:hypothetical protein
MNFFASATKGVSGALMGGNLSDAELLESEKKKVAFLEARVSVLEAALEKVSCTARFRTGAAR